MKQCCRGPSENNRIQTDPVRRDLNMLAERELSYSVVFVLMSNLKHNPYGLVFFAMTQYIAKLTWYKKGIPVAFKQ